MAGGVIISQTSKAYPGKMTGTVFFTCIFAATAGLIFGYDIGISGGVTSMPSFLKKFFPRVYQREELNLGHTNTYCKFNDRMLTLFTSSLYLAALVASAVASKITKTFGRRKSMLIGGCSFLIGAVCNGFALNVFMLIIGRVLLGIGVGFANQSAPVYVSEMAPYKYRGALNMCFQLFITIGILAANLINNFTAKIKGGLGWRISLGCAGVPALIFIVGAFCLPETPNSLIQRGKNEEALMRLKKIRGVDDVDAEFNDLIAASVASNQNTSQWVNIRKRKHRPHLVMVILIPLFQQFSGMNVFMFYAPVLFKTIGFSHNASLMSSVISGGVNAAATLVSIFTADRFGRRVLFIEGGLQMLAAQIVITVFIGHQYGWNGTNTDLPKSYAQVVVGAICVYIAGFAWSWGPLGWLVPSEILPLEIRSAGQSINVAVNMIFTFLIAELFTAMLCSMKYLLFIFFSFWVIAMTIFIWFFLPETKGIPIEEMSKIWKTHPWWKTYVNDQEDDEVVEIEAAKVEKLV